MFKSFENTVYHESNNEMTLFSSGWKIKLINTFKKNVWILDKTMIFFFLELKLVVRIWTAPLPNLSTIRTTTTEKREFKFYP